MGMDDSVLEMDGGDGWIYLVPLNCTLRTANVVWLTTAKQKSR